MLGRHMLSSTVTTYPIAPPGIRHLWWDLHPRRIEPAADNEVDTQAHFGVGAYPFLAPEEITIQTRLGGKTAWMNALFS